MGEEGRDNPPGVGRSDAPDEPTDSDGREHTFDLSFSNPIHMWRARCGCGVDLGYSALVGELGDDFDDHLEAIGMAWWRNDV